MKIFFDGGCRPGGMELAVVTGGRAFIRRDLGPGSSMDAEWLALIAAVRLAQERPIDSPLLLGDAAAVIAQATGAVRCPPRFNHHRETFHAACSGLGRLRIRYIRRSQNLAGIALAGKILRSPG